MLVCGLSNSLRAAPDAPTSAPAAFRIVFKAYDGDPKRANGDYHIFSFQIDTVDLRQPSEFLSLGNRIPNAQLKLLKFVFKEAYNEKLQGNEDVSELTIVNIVTGKTTVLPLNKVVNVSANDPQAVPASK